MSTIRLCFHLSVVGYALHSASALSKYPISGATLCLKPEDICVIRLNHS